MKLPKITRKRIYAAAPASCEITWPKGTPEPKPGHKYAMQTEDGRSLDQRVIVVRSKQLANGWKAEVKLENDRVHLLGKSGGYSESTFGAIGTSERAADGEQIPEPEAVDPSEIENYRASKEAKERFHQERAADIQNLMGAMTELRAAINSLPRDRRRSMGRPLWVLRSRLDAAERDLKRRHAA